MYIVIAGAGLVGRNLAERLVDARHDVVIIERDKAVCEYLAARLGGLVLQGTATNIDLLEQAHIERADVAVATMRSDADNLSYALLAGSFGVGRIIARMRNARYQAAYDKAGVTATVYVADVFVDQLLLSIEEPHLRQVATFGHGKASIVVDTVPDGAAVDGKTIGQIAASDAFPTECVVSGIYRPESQEFILPRGGAVIHSGDRVFLVAERANLKKASRYLHQPG